MRCITGLRSYSIRTRPATDFPRSATSSAITGEFVVPANHAIPARMRAKHITLQPQSSDGFYLHPCTIPLYCTLYCFSHYSLVEGTQPSLQNELSSFNTTPRSQVYALDVRSEALASPPHLLSQTFPTATDIRHPCRCCPRRVTGFKRKTPTAWVSSRGGVGKNGK